MTAARIRPLTDAEMLSVGLVGPYPMTSTMGSRKCKPACAHSEIRVVPRLAFAHDLPGGFRWCADFAAVCCACARGFAFSMQWCGHGDRLKAPSDDELSEIALREWKALSAARRHAARFRSSSKHDTAEATRRSGGAAVASITASIASLQSGDTR